MIKRNIIVDSKIKEHKLVLETISSKPIGQLPSDSLRTIERSNSEPDSITFFVPKRIYDKKIGSTIDYPLYKEIKNERRIILDDKEVFYIKSVTENNGETLIVKAKSGEIRLAEIDMAFEDCFLTLMDSGTRDNTYSINKELEKETNWKIGYVSDRVRFENYTEYEKGKYNEAVKRLIKLESEIRDLENRRKDLMENKSKDSLREFHSLTYDLREKRNEIEDIKNTMLPKEGLDENYFKEKDRKVTEVKKKWYDFFKDDVCDMFNCIVFFDTLNKSIVLINEDELLDEVHLYLSKDNFIKSLENTYDSDKIVTRLKVIGTKEMDIRSANCTGSQYLEDFSYFMEIREMSEELITALERYYEMVAKREPIWRDLKDLLVKKEQEQIVLASEYTYLSADIYSLNAIIEDMNLEKTTTLNKFDKESRLAKSMVELEKSKERARDIIKETDKINEEIKVLKKKIDDVIKLCQRETCTDDKDNLIFNENLLRELKEYYYTEEFQNDNFLVANVGDLIRLSKRKLREMAKPTKTWNVGLVDFVNRLKPKFKSNWKGTLALGDLVVLYDEEKDVEEFVYIVGIEQDLQEKSITLKLSNKKTTKENGKTIADYISQGKNALRDIESKKYLLLEQKYNRINVPKEYLPSWKGEEPKYKNGITID